MKIAEAVLTGSKEELLRLMWEDHIINFNEIFEPSMCERCMEDRGIEGDRCLLSERCWGCPIEDALFGDFVQQEFEGFNFKTFLDKHKAEVDRLLERDREMRRRLSKESESSKRWREAFNARIKAINEAKANGTYRAEDFPPLNLRS